MTNNNVIEQEEALLLRRKLDLLLRTGKLLVESAADTNRIVRNMKRVAAYLGLPEDKLHIDVSYTMLVSVTRRTLSLNFRSVRSMVLI